MINIIDETIETNSTETIDKFDNMDLREPLLRGIFSFGFELPTAIQRRAIKLCILGKYIKILIEQHMNYQRNFV